MTEIGQYIEIDASLAEISDRCGVSLRNHVVGTVWALFKENGTQRTPEWPHLSRIIIGNVRVVSGDGECPKTLKPAATKKVVPKKVRITASVIAKDVLALLKSKKVIATHMNYFEPVSLNGWTSGAELQPLIAMDGFQCKACGLGSMFVALVMRTGDATVADTGADRVRAKLAPYMNDRQISLVEAAFEGFESFAAGNGTPIETARLAVKFGERFADDRDRLTAICKNMLANGGVFKP